MNVYLLPVIRMQLVTTLMVALSVHVKLDTVETDSSIDASYQVSVHLAKGFQRGRLKCDKLTDDRCQVMAKAHITFEKAS
jgi:hypothetical protein